MSINEIEPLKIVLKPDARFSVLARAHNEGSALHSFWESLQKQTIIDQGEIIFLLDGSSSDGTLDYLLNRECSVYRIPAGTFNYGKSCNQLFSLARTSVLLNFSSHVILADADALETVVDFLSGRTNAAIYFRQMPNPLSGYNSYEKAFLQWHFPDKESIEQRQSSGGFSNAGAGYTRDSWERLPFHELHGAEDIDWAERFLQSGGSLFYLPHVRILHSHNYSAATLYRRTRALVEANHGTRSYFKFVFTLLGVYVAMMRCGSSFREAAEYSWAHARAYL